MAPPQYRYLVKKDRGGDCDGSVEDHYSRSELASQLVVWDEFANRYLVFQTREEYLAWLPTVPEAERCFHETIFGWNSQRIHFDIDAPAHKLAPSDQLWDDFIGNILDDVADPGTETAPRQEMVDALEQIIESILDELHVAFYGIEDIYPTREDIAVTDSSGPTGSGWKYSYHILVLPYALADNEEAREFTARVLERLDDSVRSLVDANVNKKTQNFRLAGSARVGSGRYKQAVNGMTKTLGVAKGMGPADLFVTAAPGARVLERIYTEEASAASGAATKKLNNDTLTAMLEFAASVGATEGHSFKEARGHLLCFTRDKPTHCKICREVHHKDNSLMISLDATEAGHSGAWPGTGKTTYRVVEHCRQARGRAETLGNIELDAAASRSVASSRSAAPEVAAKLAAKKTGRAHRQLEARLEAIQAKQINVHDSLASNFEQLAGEQKTVYSQDKMRDYELKPTLAVLAQMKLGKTKAMRRYLDEHFSADGIETKVVRFVTFRQTFSRSIADAFSEYTLYSDTTGDLNHVQHPRLIIQVESLHRLKMYSNPEPVDLVVLDESESIVAQFNSGLHRNFNATFAMFQWMMRTARHVVCMDANLSDRTYRMLEHMRPAHLVHFHWNQFERAAGDLYKFTVDQGSWLAQMHTDLRNGLRLVVPTNSLAEARSFEETIKREFPQKRVMMYSSETSPSEKSKHFGDVHTYWGMLDVLIYTPTCSAGVSFELDHFDSLYGYFCDISCDVESCRQMLGRVRNLRTREHYICTCASGASLPDTAAAIRRQIHDKRAGLYRGTDTAALQFEYNAAGEIVYYESDFFHIWLETVRIKNLSRNDFTCRFVDQVADTGATVELLPPLPAADTRAKAALMTAHRETRVSLKSARCCAVAESLNLTANEDAEVRDALAAGVDIDPTIHLAHEKFQLREAYSWHDRPMDDTFVNNYQSRGTRQVYKNLCRLTEGATIHESLRMMHQQENAHFDFMMDTRSERFEFINESRDLLREKHTYVFQSHSIAVWLLCICDFVCITDKSPVHEICLGARLRCALPMLKNVVSRIVYEFEIPQPNFDRLARETDQSKFISSMLRMVNGVLRIMYGLQVSRTPKRSGGDVFYLKQNSVGNLFVFSVENEADDVPGGPRPNISSNLTPQAIDATHICMNRFIDAIYFTSTKLLDSADIARPSSIDNAVPYTTAGVCRDMNDFLTVAFEEFVSLE